MMEAKNKAEIKPIMCSFSGRVKHYGFNYDPLVDGMAVAFPEDVADGLPNRMAHIPPELVRRHSLDKRDEIKGIFVCKNTGVQPEVVSISSIVRNPIPYIDGIPYTV